MRASNWFEQADQAKIRAAARARAVAASTNTAIHIVRDGKIVEIFPAREGPASFYYAGTSQVGVPRRSRPTGFDTELVAPDTVCGEAPPP